MAHPPPRPRSHRTNERPEALSVRPPTIALT
jgi:hypothetical protein